VETLEAEEEDLEEDEKSSSEKTMDELLASLGGLSSPDGPKHDSWAWLDEVDTKTLDAKVDTVVEQLQDWRRKNVEIPYESWPEWEKSDLDRWVKSFVAAFASQGEKGIVDYDATREALLSRPPVSRDESEAFWSGLTDKGQAMQLLDAMRKEGPPAGASILHKAFWDLPYKKQLEQLVSLGAVRPLLDEYAKDSDRKMFLQRHGDTLLEGVKLEHLVLDPHGPVRIEDTGLSAADLDLPENARFRMEMRAYRADDDLSASERTRELFKAWNRHKASRANYEEKLFQTGRLGLRYSDDVEDEEDKRKRKKMERRRQQMEEYEDDT
jgi:hypothetical protein